MVTADEIEPGRTLKLETRLNGEVVQSSDTSNLIFSIPRLINYASTIFTLVPGDVIATGTPAGVGWSKKPPRFMKPGDVVEVEIEGDRRSAQSGRGSVAPAKLVSSARRIHATAARRSEMQSKSSLHRMRSRRQSAASNRPSRNRPARAPPSDHFGRAPRTHPEPAHRAPKS